jgi:hypothetical protein
MGVAPIVRRGTRQGGDQTCGLPPGCSRRGPGGRHVGLSGDVMSITLRESICSAALDALIDDVADVLGFLGPTALPS